MINRVYKMAKTIQEKKLTRKFQIWQGKRLLKGYSIKNNP